MNIIIEPRLALHALQAKIEHLGHTTVTRRKGDNQVNKKSNAYHLHHVHRYVAAFGGSSTSHEALSPFRTQSKLSRKVSRTDRQERA